MKWRGSKTSHLLLKWREFAQIARLILILIPLPDIRKILCRKSKIFCGLRFKRQGRTTKLLVFTSLSSC